MPLGNSSPAFSHVPGTDPTALLRHSRGLEEPPKEGLGQREHAGGSMLPGHLCSRNAQGNKQPQTWSCSHKLEGTPECKGILPCPQLWQTSPAIPKPFLFRPTRPCNQGPLKPSEKLEC